MAELPFRLYNQLEEVKQKKELRSRQESYAKNREKARDFQRVRHMSKTLKRNRDIHNAAYSRSHDWMSLTLKHVPPQNQLQAKHHCNGFGYIDPYTGRFLR